jgi:Flp pilus assembly CpaE family ATPase
VNLLRSLGIDPARLRVVVNRWHRADDEPLQAFEKRVQLPIFERLPNDFRQVSRAVNSGEELAHGQGGQLVQKFRDMAQQITGARREVGAKRGSFLGLFSSKR